MNYRLFGMKIKEEVDLITRGLMATGILSSYKLISPPVEGLKITTARALERNMDEIPEGTSQNIYLNGLLYTAIKDSSVGYHGDSTITRQLGEIMKRYTTQGQIMRYGKRWLEGEGDEPQESSSSKRQRLENDEEEAEVDVVLGQSYDIIEDDISFDILDKDDN